MDEKMKKCVKLSDLSYKFIFSCLRNFSFVLVSSELLRCWVRGDIPVVAKQILQGLCLLLSLGLLRYSRIKER